MSTEYFPIRRGWYPVFPLLFFVSVISFFSSCEPEKPVTVPDAAFSRYISAYTSGTISRKGGIQVQLSEEVTSTHTLNEAVDLDWFSLSPGVKGKAVWIDDRTLEFKPAEELKPGQVYTATFRLGNIVKVPKEFQTFRFSVQALVPSFVVHDNGLMAVDNARDRMSFSGEIETADIESGTEVEKILSVYLDGKPLAIRWTHLETAHRHLFNISPVRRGSRPSSLSLNWDGTAAGMKQKDNRIFTIPATGDFRLLNVRAVQNGENYILVQFSDPLASGQDLKGMITVEGLEDPAFSISGSEVKLFVSQELDGNYTVNVNEGIKNLWQQKLEKSSVSNVYIENRLPSVKILGRGVIIPDAGQLVLPFEAVNLRAVDISIIKIYEKSLPQFLQNNGLDGSDELRRVAKPVVESTLPLDQDKTLDLTHKRKFSLNLDKYLKAEPGALYRVTIGFRPNYSLFVCRDTTSEREDDEEEEWASYFDEGQGEGFDDHQDFWNRYNDYYPYGYNWRQRNNPCNRAYYNKERWASRNVIASNLGLQAKRANNNQMLVTVTDILSTDPVGGVDLEIRDYQQQVILRTQTDAEGRAEFTLKQKPFLLVAQKGTQRGYLKMDDGNALPLGRFDVGGEEVKQGIKGFLYGERGVWRPGDSLFMTFILEDGQHQLPPDHPVQFELFTPQGQLYRSLVTSRHLNGFYTFQMKTDPSSPTGNWLARVKVGGARFEKRFRIETVMPNRLKIDLDLGPEVSLGKQGVSQATLSSRWLFGAVAQNLKARVDASLYPGRTGFPAFRNFIFDNPASVYEPENRVVFDGRLDAEGKALIKLDMNPGKEPPGILRANLLTKVFEPGGAFSVNSFSVPYHPYETYAGISVPEGPKPWGFLYTNREYPVEIVNVDAKGRLVSGSKEMEMEWYAVQWRWWWDESGNDLGNFNEDRYHKLIKKQKITLQNGRATWKVSAPGGQWGRYLLLVKDPVSGHTTGKVIYFDDPYWQTRSTNDPSAAAMLSFTADREKYSIGEEVRLTIPSDSGGQALISIENGSRILQTHRVITTKGQTRFAFRTEKGMAPNIYVNVTLLQPHAQVLNDLPIRMYGMIPITVEDNNTWLKPQLSMQAEIRPEQPASLTVSEATGNEMTYSLAIVDEGLLDLTRFKTPDPHAAFFAREALGVKTWDLFDLVLGARGMAMDRILSIGGDESAGAPVQPKSANRFPPVVRFMGPFHLEKGARQKHQFTLPKYIGSVRVMLVAAQDGRYGWTEKPVAVRKPLMVLATVPRVLGPGEQVRIPVTIFSMDPSLKTVNLGFQANSFLEPVGEPARQIQFSSPGEKMVYFDYRVKSITGTTTLKWMASAGREKADVEINIDVRNPNPPVTRVDEVILSPGESRQIPVEPIGDRQTSKATLEFSTLPPMNLAQRLDFLVQYPHGCVEQTTSAVFPQLYLKNLLELSEKQKAEIDRNIRAAIERLKIFQVSEGGFSYWPAERQADDWGTNYAGHFLLEAAQRGYTVMPDLVLRWINWQRQKANGWAPGRDAFYGGDLTQAYRLFLLALARAPELGAMNRLREFQYLSPEAKWRLAAAYQAAGQPAIAGELTRGLSTTFSKRERPGISFGSDLRDQAMVLETLTLMNKRREGEELVKTIAARLSQSEWYSTQTTAYSLLAIAAFSGKNPASEKLQVTVTHNRQTFNIQSSSYLRQEPVSVKEGKTDVRVTNNGKQVLYLRLITSGQPFNEESAKAIGHPEIIQVSTTYLTLSGETLDIDHLGQGTDFVAKVSVRNPGRRGDYTELALSQVFPPGWEILNTRLLNNEGRFKSAPFSYQDIRDDRVYTYFDLREGQSLVFYVMLNAAYAGRYYLPGAYCEAMYDHAIEAGEKGKWVEVKAE